MAATTLPSHRSSLLLGFAFLVVLLVGSGLAWLASRQGFLTPVRVLLITPSPEPGSGLAPAESRAIGALVQDHLEHCGGFAVTSVTDLPANLDPIREQARVLLVQIDPSRQGDQLSLTFRYAWGRDLSKDSPTPWTLRKGALLPPRQAFAAFLGAFPQQMSAPGDGLVPATPSVFWDIVRSGALRLQNEHLEEAMDLAERAVRREPTCASTWILLGNLRYRRMLNSSAAIRQEQAETEAQLQRGLALVPGHPRGAFLLSLLKADSGNQREALDLLVQARRGQPNNPTLLTGIAYAARGAGLLPLARRAMDMRDSLAFSSIQAQAVDITCLYTGEFSRFEASLQEQPGHLRSTSGVIPFYRGYLALVRGDRARAHQEFQIVQGLTHAYPNIVRLSEIFDLILEGRNDAAWGKLREYDQERIGMREPDGEFTIRLAEAYALMGDRASAMDMASRAFARGFGCTTWYEQSPLLEPLRGLPRWQALLQHLKERQSLMEERFPLRLLDAN